MDGIAPKKDTKAFLKKELPEQYKSFEKSEKNKKKKKKFVYKPPPPKPVQPNLHDTFDEASKVLEDAMIKIGNEIIAGKEVAATLYKTTPGIGKTEAALKLACKLAHAKKTCFLASVTRNMSWQIYDRIHKLGQGLRPIVVDGRHGGYDRKWIDNEGLHVVPVERNCHNYEKVEMAHKKGYPVYKFVCAGCNYCPTFKYGDGEKVGYEGACPYYKRIYEARGWKPVFGTGGTMPIFLLTHHMMANFHIDSETMRDRMDLAIYDEDPTAALRTTYVWTEQELGKKLINDNMKPLREFLKSAIWFAEYYRIASNYICGKEYYQNPHKSPECKEALEKSKYMGTVILHGKRLAAVLKHAAEMSDVNLIDMLEMAETMDTGLSDGYFIKIPNFTSTDFDKLAHYKEPELANELKKVVLDADNGEEFAYKISLRWDELNGWSVVWDEVRQINYGKSLILLDAYGEKLIADRITGRSVDVQEVHCKIRNNVTVKVFPEVNTSKKSMSVYKDKIFDTYIDPELRKLKGSKVLFYVQKCYVEWLKKRIDKGSYKFDTFVVKYFWQDRGDDSYGDFDSLCIVGTPWSNIVGERNFCNALFHGDIPIDWSTGVGFVPNDPRVKAHQEARQEKEMLQALFRLRPSKPRDKGQNVLIFSNMKLPLEYEMPGAQIEKQKEASVDKSGIGKTMLQVYKKFGCWTDYLISFYSRYEEIFEWFDNGGLESVEDFPLSYEELCECFKLMANKEGFDEATKNFFQTNLNLNVQTLNYRGKEVPCWGDAEKLESLLDTLRLATRSPGVDDNEEPYEPSEAPESDTSPWDAETPTEAPEPESSQEAASSEPSQGQPANGGSGLSLVQGEDKGVSVEPDVLFGDYEEPSQGPDSCDLLGEESDKPPDEE
jgi:hypothetical protein